MITGADFPKLPWPKQMAQWDQEAINFGIPDIMLMENASRSACNILISQIGKIRGKKILFLMGAGNNGGDAACMARHMLDMGALPLVIHTKNLEDLKGAVAFHTRLALADGVMFAHLNEPAEDFFDPRNIIFQDPEIIVDGLVGTGFTGDLKPELRNLIEKVNLFARSTHATVMAIDIPSGLNAISGSPAPVAVRADFTATMAAAKPGLLLPHARVWTGKIFCCNIGMPAMLEEKRPADMRLADGRCLLAATSMPDNSYKNIYGHVLVIGGKGATAGAAHLAALAALRQGAGLVSAACPGQSVTQVKGNLAELMTTGLTSPGEDNWPEDLGGDFAALINSCQALVIGPGMGRDRDSEKFLNELLELDNRPPAVFDADALVHLAHNSNLLKKLSSNDIITPHPGEAGELLNMSAKDIQKDRLAAIRALIGRTRAVTVLKGASTLISQAGQSVFICPYDIPQMAVGGAGDVLAGCLGALLANRETGSSSLEKTLKGVVRHILAGMLCTQKFPDRGVLASDLANALCETDSFLRNQNRQNLRQGIMPWP